MTAIPDNAGATLEDLARWQEKAKELGKIKAEEAALRLKCFRTFFPEPKEGTNNYELEQNYILKGKHVVNREVDIAAFTAMADVFAEKKLSVDKLVDYKPVLVKKEYNELTEEEKQLFDQCLIVKDGMPSLEIVLPAKFKLK